MTTKLLQPPAELNYQVQQAIEQMVSTLPKGTDLGLCDVISAMFSGYFIESGGGIMPAVDQYLAKYISDEKARAARSRRAAKAITYGQYHLNELISRLNELVSNLEDWEPTVIQGYQLKPVDMTSYKRPAVQALKSKSYDSTVQRAVPAVPFGIMGTTGMVNNQRVALLDMVVCGELDKNVPSKEMDRVYKKVSQLIRADELAIFDAGFSLIDAMIHGIDQCVTRLASNCTFGATAGKVPARTSNKGPDPSRHQAEIVRPVPRQHKDKILSATQPDETEMFTDEFGKEITVDVWHSVYFLERHLDRVEDERLKRKLRNKALKVVVIYHPDFKTPLILGTPIQTLTSQSLMAVYTERWPIEGIPQTGKYLLSGGGGRHYVHHPQAMKRLPALSMIFGSAFKILAAIFPPIRSGFWDRAVRPTYGRLLRYLKKVGLPLSAQLFKKASKTAHLPVGYEAIRLSRASCGVSQAII